MPELGEHLGWDRWSERDRGHLLCSDPCPRSPQLPSAMNHKHSRSRRQALCTHSTVNLSVPPILPDPGHSWIGNFTLTQGSQGGGGEVDRGWEKHLCPPQHSGRDIFSTGIHFGPFLGNIKVVNQVHTGFRCSAKLLERHSRNG